MKSLFAALVAGSLAGFALAPAGPAQAESPAAAHAAAPTKAGDLSIEAPWTRATPNGAKVGGGFVRIVNAGKESDRLVSAASPIAARVELHESSVDNGVMKMRARADGIEIPAGGAVDFKPGGLHIMFIDLKKPIAADDHVPVTLTFQKAGAVQTTFEARALGAGAHKH